MGRIIVSFCRRDVAEPVGGIECGKLTALFSDEGTGDACAVAGDSNAVDTACTPRIHNRLETKLNVVPLILAANASREVEVRNDTLV